MRRPAEPFLPLRRPATAVVWTAAVLLGACGRERPAAVGVPGGTLVIATAGDADVLLPPLVTTIQGAQVTSQVFDRLAEPDSTVGTAGDAHLRPRLARSWRWAPDSMSVAFALDPRARWHDGRSVTAADVSFSHALTVDPATASPVAPLLADVDSVTAPDSLTAVAWFGRRRPDRFFAFTYNLWVLPRHLLAGVPRAELAAGAFARRPVGSGRFRFGSWTPGQAITLVADTANYRGRPRLDRVVWACRRTRGRPRGAS
jgi:peptide/nickel transport system substrate-binding protein